MIGTSETKKHNRLLEDSDDDVMCEREGERMGGYVM